MVKIYHHIPSQDGVHQLWNQLHTHALGDVLVVIPHRNWTTTMIEFLNFILADSLLRLFATRNSLHISFSSPARILFLGPASLAIIVYFTDLALCARRCCWFTTQWTAKQLKDVSLPKIRERLPPYFTSFTGSVASRVQEPNFFAVGE